jgi:Tfp pilus assembly protein PilZ
MFVATSRAPEIGDYVELVFSLPGDNRSFRVRGNVVFLDQTPPVGSKRPGFGARFERPPVTLLDAIRNLHREH